LGIPKSKIIADRAFNAISLSKAYKQLAPVQDVTWDPRQDPTRLSFSYSSGLVGEDMRPLGERRGELYLTARKTEQPSSNPSVFAATERFRFVELGPGTVIVSDNESITEFTLVDANNIKAVTRIAVYLTPNPNSREGVLWQQVGGKAVAFFDYELEMNRILEDFIIDGTTTVQRACVKTPKDIIQCE
jgi:hypothetical protein